MAGADEDFGSKVGQMWLIFVQAPTTNPTAQHDPHGPDDPLMRRINYHHLDIPGHDGIDDKSQNCSVFFCSVFCELFCESQNSPGASF
jgi:hypothetical protein